MILTIRTKYLFVLFCNVKNISWKLIPVSDVKCQFKLNLFLTIYLYRMILNNKY